MQCLRDILGVVVAGLIVVGDDPDNRLGEIAIELGRPLASPARVGGGREPLPAGWVRATLGDVTAHRVEQSVPDAGSEQFVYVDIGSIGSAKDIAVRQLVPTRDAASRARQNLKAGDVVVSHLDTYAALLLRNASLEPGQLSLLAVASGLQAANPDGLERESVARPGRPDVTRRRNGPSTSSRKPR